MTNLEKIRTMSAEELAALLVHNEREEDFDEDIDGEWKSIRLIDNYVSPCSPCSFWSYDDCLEETIDWLHEEANMEDDYE